MPTRVSSALITSRQALGLWAVRHLTELSVRVAARARLGERVPPRLQRLGAQAWQRLGAQAWQRLVTRFPTLVELLGEAVREAEPAPASAAAAAAPAPAVRQQALRPQPTLPTAVLIDQLRSENAEVAVPAATELGNRDGDDSLEALLEVLRNPDGFFHPVTRAAALRALAPRLAGERLTLLVDAVRDVDAEVSLAAIGSLAQHAPSHVVLDALMPILADHTGFYLPVVRDTAVSALERAGLLSHA
jgi:hypothetical protein